MNVKLICACAALVLSLGAATAMAPIPHIIETAVRAGKSDLDCYACSTQGKGRSHITDFKVGETTTVLIRWDKTSLATR